MTTVEPTPAIPPVEVAPPAAPTVVPPATPEAPVYPPELGDPGKRAIDRMAAERDEALKKLKAFEDEKLSDLEKLTRDRDAATAELSKLRVEKDRRDAADAVGLPAAWVDRLRGSTPEELQADATSLLASLNVPAGPPVPAPDASQGVRPISATAAEDAEYAAYRAQLFPSNQ